MIDSKNITETQKQAAENKPVDRPMRVLVDPEIWNAPVTPGQEQTYGDEIWAALGVVEAGDALATRVGETHNWSKEITRLDGTIDENVSPGTQVEILLTKEPSERQKQKYTAIVESLGALPKRYVEPPSILDAVS